MQNSYGLTKTEAGSSGCGANLPIHAEEKKLFMIGEMCSIGFAATGNDKSFSVERSLYPDNQINFVDTK